jgi:putative intracellular protease/amidase
LRRHAVRDGNLITGQQQNSGGAAARLVLEALGNRAMLQATRSTR